MSESGDYDPGPWTGHDFGSAYSRYDSHVGRSYGDAVAKVVACKDLLEPSVKTKCTNPLIILTDVTGSMGEWPKVMFSKLPYLEHEAKVYLGKDLEICFGAIGDAHPDRNGGSPDKYPLQIRAFAKGTALKDRMLELVIEGGGGGQIQETYELGALYCVHKVEMPKAIKPVVIMIGDEKPYGTISPEMAKDVVGVDLESQVYTKTVFDQLKEKFSVYLIRKPYGDSSGDAMSPEDKEIRARWIELLGADHICELPSADRVVDVIFGILANETGRIEDFREEIEGRQREDQVATVYKSLASIHKMDGRGKTKGRSGQSIMKIAGPAGRTKRLM